MLQRNFPADQKCFAVFCENRAEALISLVAILKSRVPGLLIGWSDHDDFRLGCAGRRPELVVCSSGCLAAVLTAAPAMPWLKEVLVANGGAPLPDAAELRVKIRSLEKFLQEVPLKEVPVGPLRDEDTCLYVPPSRGSMMHSCSALTFDQIGFAIRQML